MPRINVILLVVFIIGMLLGGCRNTSQNKCTDSVSSEKEIGGLISIEAVEEENSFVNIIDTCMLRFYYPDYSWIDLVCGKMPDKGEDSVILVCAAAYTVKCLDHFEHSNIIGNHVAGGKLYNGAPMKLEKGAKVCYRGAFSFYDGKPHFSYDNWNKDSIGYYEGGMWLCTGYDDSSRWCSQLLEE